MWKKDATFHIKLLLHDQKTKSNHDQNAKKHFLCINVFLKNLKVGEMGDEQDRG